MDTQKLLRQAANLVWHDRTLWLLGLLSSSGRLIGTVIRLALLFGLPVWMGSVEWSAAEVSGFLFQQASWVETRNWLMVGLIVVTAASLLLWIISTMAEGGMIAAVASRNSGRQLESRAALGQGYRHLVQFVGVDTILYFPAFMFLLLLMLTATAATAGFVYMELSGRPSTSLEGSLAAAAACMTPMLLMLLPVYLFTQLYRRVAFRKVMLAHFGVRESIRGAWKHIRRKPGSIIVVAALLWGTAYLLSMIFSLVELPLFAIIFLPYVGDLHGPANSLAEATHWLAPLHALVLLVSAGMSALVHAFTSVVWTMVMLPEERLEE